MQMSPQCKYDQIANVTKKQISFFIVHYNTNVTKKKLHKNGNVTQNTTVPKTEMPPK